MERKERFALYEKLYFHELERIEKVSARLSLPFTVMLAIIAFLAFMLNSETKPYGFSIATYCFWLLFSLSSFALLAGAWFFRLAWFGHDDKLLPVARTIEDYYVELEETYKEFDGGEELTQQHFNNFLFDYYAQFASENAINNDKRSYNIYRSIVALMFSIFLAFAAAIPFYLHDHENSSNDKASTAAPATQTP
ncbi:hypothetical protein [Spongiibacter tropicus]|uniref:hypothetical protein n=1 Tax=Spongiibacter tropicus TaxID=454602 RepID=UPI0024E22D14|nr:hypothetical protein [Spongiibacter tropicus]